MPEAEWSAVLTGLVELASRAGADPTVAPSRLLGKGNASELLSRCPGGRCRGLALRLLSAAHGSEAAADLTRRIAKAALCGDGALHSRAARDAALAGELMGSLACLAGSEREWASVWGGTTAALRGEGGDVAGALHIVGAAMADDRLREATLQSGAVTAVHEALLFAARGGADGAQDGASDPEGHALALRALAAVLACKVAMHCHLGSEEASACPCACSMLTRGWQCCRRQTSDPQLVCRGWTWRRLWRWLPGWPATWRTARYPWRPLGPAALPPSVTSGRRKAERGHSIRKRPGRSFSEPLQSWRSPGARLPSLGSTRTGARRPCPHARPC